MRCHQAESVLLCLARQLPVVERLKLGDVRVIVPTLLLAELAASISRVRRDPIRARITVDVLQALPFIEFIDLDRTLGQEAAAIAADRALKGADTVYLLAYRRPCARPEKRLR